jgi:4'-phosphopantetheinyl transferase
VFKAVLADYLGVGPRRIELATNKYGKPELLGSRLQASLSRSEGFSAIAVSCDVPVGIDLEVERAVPNCHELAMLLMSSCEERIFSTYTDSTRPRKFLELWTRKEAVLKCFGTGLRVDPRSITVGWNRRTVRVETNTLWVADIGLGTNFVCALSSMRAIEARVSRL